MNRRILALATLVAAAMSVAAAGDVVEYERNADEWLDAVPCEEVRAFDEFYPGGAEHCVLPPGQLVGILEFVGGTVTVTAVDDSQAIECAVADATGGVNQQDSDGWIGYGTATLTFEFDPPIFSFYAFYGSLGGGTTATMHLYAGEDLVDEITGPVGDNQPYALGHGFVSLTPVDRVVIDKTDPSPVLLGSFIGLHDGEPSLGTITIPGYDGLNGEIVELDFALAWQECASCARADINDDGLVDVSDFLHLIAEWGPCPGCPEDIDRSGVVNVIDFLILLGLWGPCN
ncbi:MAG: hypothetical protein ACYSUF_00565 [Planctomycetota bacterium]|jgi:hypothetical protein